MLTHEERQDILYKHAARRARNSMVYVFAGIGLAVMTVEWAVRNIIF